MNLKQHLTLRLLRLCSTVFAAVKCCQAYFLVADLVLCYQYFYYEVYLRRHRHEMFNNNDLAYPLKKSRGNLLVDDSSTLKLRPNISSSRLLGCFMFFVFGSLFTNTIAEQPFYSNSSAGLGRKVLSMPQVSASNVGVVLGWISAIMYIKSRVFQIYKNFIRQSAEGLSSSMFISAIAANVLYGISVILFCNTYAKLRANVPWLVGSLGTCFFDTIIFYQFKQYQPEAGFAL